MPHRFFSLKNMLNDCLMITRSLMRAVLKTLLLSWTYYFSYNCKWQKYYAWSVTYLHISHVLIFSHGTCSHIGISHMFSYCHISHIIMLSHVHMFTCCHMLVCKCLEQKPNICFHMWVHCLRKYDMSHVTYHMSHVTCHMSHVEAQDQLLWAF